MSTPGVPQQPETQPQSPLTQPHNSPAQQPNYPAQQHPGQQFAPQQSFTPPAAAQYAQQQAPAPKATTLDKTNTFALLAIVLAFLSPIAAIIFGHMGLSQIKRTGDAGRGIALTGLIIGYVYTASMVVFIIAYVGLIFVMVGSISSLSRMY